jgi:hypothetical protein
MRTLAQYVDFGPHAPPAIAGPSVPATGSALASLRKGMSVREVEALLGPAETATESKEGSLTLVKRIYAKDGMKVSASFVSGVLIDFAVTPN